MSQTNRFLLSLRRTTSTIATLAMLVAASAHAKTVTFDIPAQSLASAINEFSRQSGRAITAPAAVLRDKTAPAIKGAMTPDEALERLLQGTGLHIETTPGGAQVIQQRESSNTRAESPETTLSEIIVTAQKREERISDVPIAITALTSEGLDARKIEGGSELLRAIPNVNFSKSNFSMYNFSIRGVGTKAVSASSDPAVAVSFNNTPLVRNRLFESEFFDMERVEVLRGPQGTLYGRNATAGVVNMIPALPEPDFGGEIKGELGNYNSKRLNGMINLPVTDTLGIRIAGAWTKRDGFDYNTFTENRVNDRDLWSTRASVQWEPSDRFRANVIWQHFEENDNRSRTGKQLCHTDPGPELFTGDTIADRLARGKLSQGCQPGSLYDDAAYGTPNGASMAYVFMLQAIGIGFNPNLPGPFQGVAVGKDANPYEGTTQSRNLREISTSIDPVFRAKNDVVQFNMDFDVTDSLKLVSQTAYARDRFYSMQDYNRFVSNPAFNDSASPDLRDPFGNPFDIENFPGPTPGGVFCDPQLGCSDRLLSADLSRSRNRQWSQELRLQSSFDGPVNFNIGANYLDFKTQDDYYVFNNAFTLIADWFYSRDSQSGSTERFLRPCPLGDESRECPYVDRNPIESLDNQGHNYFLSQNGVRIKSWAAFGELYWSVTDTVNLTLGARYTRDKKVSDQVPSQLLLGGGVDHPAIPPGDATGGRVNSGYPALDSIEQTWGKFTGRAVLDWKPELSFTDDTLVYLSLARGYKGGGVNPPRVDFNSAVVQYQFLPQTFKPEYVNSIEIGTKNSFDGGRLTLNANAFLYDYKDYQVSQIVDRISYNENFDAINWGLELEAAWRPTRAFRLDGNLGYLKTRLKKGSKSIDVMNRTQGDDDWMVVRPWVQVPSSCIAPRAFVDKIANSPFGADLAGFGLSALCPGSNRIGNFNPDAVPGQLPYWALYGFTYDPFADYNPDTVGLDIANGGSGAPNGGRGFSADLTGNELPNAPRWTVNVGAQYTFYSESDDWELTFRADYYWQAKSYARIYNTAFDRLKAWDNVNLSATYMHSPWGLTVQAYVKNVFNNAPITDTFVNSDDTGLTTNVFTLDPRIFGFSVAKKF